GPVWGNFVEADFPFFSSTLDARKLGGGLPENNLTPRGLILNLGNNCWACFDLDLLRVAAMWVGDAVTPVSMSQLSYHSGGTKAVEGEEFLPEIVGVPWIASGIYPGWQISESFSPTDPREPSPDKKETGRGSLPRSLGRFNRLRLASTGILLEY